MRSTEEWYALKWHTGKPVIDWIEAIQADALEAAAKVCVDRRPHGKGKVYRLEEFVQMELAETIRSLIPPARSTEQ